MLTERTPKSPANRPAPTDGNRRIHANGEMADRIRAFPWERTSLGSIAQWPEVLVWSINSMLENRFPTSILWGTEMLHFYNDAYLPLTAEKHPALLGRSAPEAWAEAWHVIGPQFQSVLQHGETVYQENVAVPCLRNGIVQDVYWTYSYSPIRSSKGEVLGILVVCHDVTGVMLANRERDAVAANLQSVLDSITDGLAILDKNWRYTYFNKQGAAMLGMLAEDLIGQNVWELFPHAERTEFYWGYHQAVETGQPVHFEEFYPAPLDKWLECHCYPSQQGLSVYFRDITDRKRSQQALQASESRFRKLFESSLMGIGIPDRFGAFREGNDELLRMTGYTREDLNAGLVRWDTMTPPEYRELDIAHISEAAERGSCTPYQKEYIRKDGSRFPIVCGFALLEGSQDEYIGFVLDLSTQKLAEESLRRSEERFRTLFEIAPLGVAITDTATGRLLFANEEMARITGYAVEELTQMCSNDLTHPDDREQNRDLYRRIANGASQAEVVTKRYVRKDGKAIWVRVCIRAIHDPVHRTTQILGTVEDVTESLNAQKATEESEARLTALVDSIATLAWMANADGAIFWFNRRWYEYTGTTAEQMNGWGWQSVHDPEILPAVMEKWNRSIQTGQPFEMVFPLRGADGVFRSFMTRIVPVKDAAGNVARWFGTNTEIDELERTRAELATAQERIGVALKNVPLILYTADRELRYTWMHRPHDKFNIDEVLGRRPDEIESSESIHTLMDFKRAVMERDTADRQEMTLTIKGVEEVYDINAEPIHGPDGTVVGVTVAAHDITGQKLAEEALRKSEKLAVAGRLAASIAHEINNPLESVTNLLYLVKTTATDDQTLTYAAMAEEEMARVSNVAIQSLRFHRQSTVPTLEKMSSTLESAAAIYQTRLVSHRIAIQRQYREESLVRCYSSELRQVFGNLIGNAFDALQHGGTIHLRTRDTTDVASGTRGIRITVADTGHGMDPRTLQRIAEPFFTTKGMNGTGLGLWISRGILKKHHAKLRIKSRQGEGRSGSVFSIFLPLAAIAEPAMDEGAIDKSAIDKS